jgi:hypothetical protein
MCSRWSRSLSERHDPPLVLEGLGVVDEQVELKQTDDHAAGLVTNSARAAGPGAPIGWERLKGCA